jgi:hypothetical protein
LRSKVGLQTEGNDMPGSLGTAELAGFVLRVSFLGE